MECLAKALMFGCRLWVVRGRDALFLVRIGIG